MNPRLLVRRAVASPPAEAALGLMAAALERAAGSAPHSLPILMYHRVDEADARPELAPSLLSATPAGFEAQMRHLARRWRPIGADELLALRRRGARPPDRSVLVTVDDAYADFAEHAWPVLRRLRVPVILFVPTALPDTDGAFWWDRLWDALRRAPAGAIVEVPRRGPAAADRPDAISPWSATLTDRASRLAAHRRLRGTLKALDHDALLAAVDGIVRSLAGPGGEPAPARPAVLGWDDLRSLAADGVALGPHSRTHPLLTSVPDARLADEIAGSLADLRDRVPDAVPILAYPAGAHDGRVRTFARDAGVEVGLSTERGGNDLRGVDWLRLRRSNVGAATPTPLVRLQLLPWLARRRGPDAPPSGTAPGGYG